MKFTVNVVIGSEMCFCTEKKDFLCGFRQTLYSIPNPPQRKTLTCSTKLIVAKSYIYNPIKMPLNQNMVLGQM